MEAPAQLPTQVLAAHRGWRTVLMQAPYRTATWRLSSADGRVRFAKVAPDDLYPTLEAERDRMIWARGVLPVPDVVDHGRDGGAEWLVTTALPGIDATRVEGDPGAVVRALGEGLRRFHDAPAGDCPFDFTLDAALEHCAGRVADGRATHDDLHEEFRRLTPASALDEIVRTRPAAEDVVVCHGDYCFPNALLEDGVVTGYLDLGELGLADRWWDIAVGAWSVTWNVDPKWEPAFYESYGVDPDPERIRFYRLLYDLAS